ncbi:MAG: ferric reductase-like transmembrane domain-containing protein [Pseudomonadota bacterium]
MAAHPSSARAILIWAVLAAALIVPVAVAATSPLLAWREPVYIAAGFAGVVTLGLLLLQPLLAGGYLPGVSTRFARRLHALVGGGLLVAVVVHVVGLWITSPPDVIDALLFRSPTPFSIWGVIAMWTVLAAALFAAFRRRLRLRPAKWRLVHLTLSTVIIAGTVLHAMLIEGTMGLVSKAVICALVVAALVKLLVDLQARNMLIRRKA